jgi:ABC-type dipeptide/oligopeptide/nickel transport system permease component
LKLLPYLGRRAAFFLPQVLGILLITFILVRMIPGDPARLMAGPLMTEEGVELIRQQMGLTEPLPVQFILYVKNAFQGDLGNSWVTGNPVMTDIATRLPATMELLGLTLLVVFFIMLPIAIKSASAGKGLIQNVAKKVFFGYGMAATALPDFWLALILIFVFYAVLGWAPAPVGQLDIGVAVPARITGMYLIDSLLTGNWAAFQSSLTHLILPVFVLAFVYGGAACKIAIVAASNLRKSAFVNFAKVCGLSVATIERYVTRASYPPVATFTAVTWAFLIGGAVLVETVFSWAGFGQYAVQAVINSDFAAIQGVVLVSAVMCLIMYILVDMIYFWVDPRVRSIG